MHYVFDPTAVAADGAVALKLLLFSVLLHYLQNISSIYFLAHVSVLSHQVAQSLKRLMVITCSVIYFLTPVTPLNVVGMGLAIVGFSAYSLTKQSPAPAAERRRSIPDSSFSEVEKDIREVERGSAGSNGSSAYHSSAANSRHGGTPRHMEGSAAGNDSLSVPSSTSSHAAHSAHGLFRPPVSPGSDSPGVLDSYALVRQSELGSSHLLQSPSRSKLHSQPHVHSSHTNGHHHPHSPSHGLEETEFLLDDHSREQRGGGREESDDRRNGRV